MRGESVRFEAKVLRAVDLLIFDNSVSGGCALPFSVASGLVGGLRAASGFRRWSVTKVTGVKREEDASPRKRGLEMENDKCSSKLVVCLVSRKNGPGQWNRAR